MGTNSGSDIAALRAHLEQQRVQSAQAAYQRALDDNRAMVQAIRDEWASARQSAGGSMPDDIVDAQIAALEADLNATANDLRIALGL